MSTRKTGLLSKHRRGVGHSPTDDVRLPYTAPSYPTLAKYPPQHSERRVPPITHGIHLNHDPEHARLRMPSDPSESSITLSIPKPDQAHPADARTSKVRGCFIDDDDTLIGTHSCSYRNIPLSFVGLCSSFFFY